VLSATGPAGISAWRGPFGDEQDFVHGEWIIEIKTQLNTADQRMQISSEAQLDTSSVAFYSPTILAGQVQRRQHVVHADLCRIR
jgi:hypothetical protein